MHLMKDNYIFFNFFRDREYWDMAKNNPIIFELYEKYYSYWDLTKTMPENKSKFNEYLSSPLIEILISDPIFSWYLEERISKSSSFIWESMTLLWKVNNNFKNLYLSKDKNELIERFWVIFDIFLDFINSTYEIIDHDESIDLNDSIMLTTEHVMHIINNSFKNSIVIKYLILSAICEYIKYHPLGPIDEDNIAYIIRRFITTGEHEW